ncbi:hypothetical protein [Desulfobacter latus]|nr:hypothetical protein [Desulfobacter latus]
MFQEVSFFLFQNVSNWFQPFLLKIQPFVLQANLKYGTFLAACVPDFNQ